jgi:hypothetical protein
VDRHVQRFKNTDVGFSTVAAQTELSVFNSVHQLLRAVGSSAAKEQGVRQRAHDKAEILRRVQRSFTTSGHRITRQKHTLLMQVWLAFYQERQRVQGLHSSTDFCCWAVQLVKHLFCCIEAQFMRDVLINYHRTHTNFSLLRHNSFII